MCAGTRSTPPCTGAWGGTRGSLSTSRTAWAARVDGSRHGAGIQGLQRVFVAPGRGADIGRGGSRLREVGTTALTSIEALLGQPVYLDLHVKIAKDWQRDPKQLQRLGF